jgi:hypothetical protein
MAPAKLLSWSEGAKGDRFGRAAAVVQTLEAFLGKAFAEKRPLITGLLHSRDLVTFGARRRNGKTTKMMNLAADGATGEPTYLGYPIVEPFRTLLLLLEDDPRELQDKFSKIVAGRSTHGRVALYTREDFLDRDIPIDATNAKFQAEVQRLVRAHKPDVIVLDNLAQLIGADFNAPKLMHELMKWVYLVARETDAAIIIPAHPRKQQPDNANQVTLFDEDVNLDAFFESVMGSSHLINSTGNLWGMERRPNDDTTVFIGGRQRVEGYTNRSYFKLTDQDRMELISDAVVNLASVLNTDARNAAWKALPEPPTTFTYSKAQQLVTTTKNALGKSAFEEWMRECRRLGVVVKAADGKKLVKAAKKSYAGTLVGKVVGKSVDAEEG